MPETRDLPDIVLSRLRPCGLAAIIICLWLAGCAPRSFVEATATPDKSGPQTKFINYAPGLAHPAALPQASPETSVTPEETKPPVTAPAPILAAPAEPTENVPAPTPQAIVTTPTMPVEAEPASAQAETAIAAIIMASDQERSEETPAPPAAKAEKPPQRNPDDIIASNETTQPTATTTVSDYYLSPGDVIEISVWGEEMTREVIVPPDGKVSYFLIGQLRIADRTMEEIRDEIEKRLAEYIVNPKVIVLGKNFIGNAASVLGAVNQPGQKTINPGDRITDLLAKAGGFMYILGDNTSEDSRLMADLSGAYLSRHGKNQDIDMVRLLDQGDMSQNVMLLKGDLLFIPYTKRANVYALGEVANPTVIHFREDLTLLDVIAHAGGLNKTTYKDEICIIRGSLKDPEVIRLHYPSILNGTETNRLLMAGDIVYVPATMVTSIERLSRQIIPFLDALVRKDEAL